MANSLASNISTVVLPMFMEEFEANKVLLKTVDKQTFDGQFNPSRGTTISVKRPHDYRVSRTSDGDLTSETASDIISGKATATVQNYFTVTTEFGNLEEATSLDQLRDILRPMATRIITDLETDLASYMMKNAGLVYGTVGTAIDAWTDVSGAAAFMRSMGVPEDEKWCYVVNPHTGAALAALQTALSPGQGTKVDTAWENAVVSNNMGGFRVMQSNALASRTNTTAADLAGILAAAPTLTYLGAKDTMTQAWSVSGFTGSAVIKAGSVVQVTGKYRQSLATRQPILDASGAQVLFRAVVTADVTLSTAGAGIITVSSPGIYEATGQYNTTTAALAQNDVVTIQGTSAAVYQPALFYHPKAFTCTTVKLPKLAATDTNTATQDGMTLRVTRWSDGTKNKQKIRFDLLPAYGVLNPHFAGQAYGI